MISKSSSNTNFGWGIKTHKKITKLALENSNLKLKEHHKKMLIRASKQPDIEEISFFGSDHFCFAIPKDMKPVRFLSFLDFSGNHNALAKFIKHLEKSQKALLSDKKHKALEEIGRAIHFLQDMCVPLHTEKGAFMPKLRDSRMHVDYEENFVGTRLGKLISPQKVSETDNSQDFKTFALSLFKENFDFSSKYKISKKNKNAWEPIAQETMNQAVGSTQKLLNAFSDLFIAQKVDEKIA
jgi:hypothetical protein